MENEIAEIIEKLNEKGKCIALNQIKAIQEAYPKEPEDPEPLTWTGSFRAVKREDNIIYPEWG
jgi:hypothetical protein